MERSCAQLRERISKGERENAIRVEQMTRRHQGLPLSGLVMPQTADEAEALRAQEQLTGNKLLLRSQARKILDQQRSDMLRSKGARAASKRQEHFKYGSDGVRPSMFSAQRAEERRAAELAIEAKAASSSSSISASASCAKHKVFDDDFSKAMDKFIKDNRAWCAAYLFV